MHTQLTPSLREGIATVGIGKGGSRFCPPDLVQKIVEELKGDVSPVAKAAFFTSLYMKGIEECEMPLSTALPSKSLTTPRLLIEDLLGEIPVKIAEFCAELLEGCVYDRQRARALGQFLFGSDHAPQFDAARGMIAAILRMRHTTAAEYAGILDAIEETLHEKFQEAVPAGKPIVQLADPFDGMLHAHLLSPVIAHHLVRSGYRVVSMVGESSGPKYGVNQAAVAKRLNAKFMEANSHLGDDMGRFSLHLHQESLSKELSHWVKIRQQTIKRPLLATLEKFVNPMHAPIFIGSAFHVNFAEKMLDIAQETHRDGAIVFFKTCEGSLGLSLGRAAICHVMAKNKDGIYERGIVKLHPEDIGLTRTTEPKLASLTAEENAQLITAFIDQGSSEDEVFNHRAKLTLTAVDRSLAWIKERN